MDKNMKHLLWFRMHLERITSFFHPNLSDDSSSRRAFCVKAQKNIGMPNQNMKGNASIVFSSGVGIFFITMICRSFQDSSDFVFYVIYVIFLCRGLLLFILVGFQ